MADVPVTNAKPFKFHGYLNNQFSKRLKKQKKKLSQQFEFNPKKTLSDDITNNVFQNIEKRTK